MLPCIGAQLALRKLYLCKLVKVSKKGASLELQIRKGKKNQTKKLQRCIVHPNAKAYAGNFCPVAILDTYLAARLKLVPASGDDLVFPTFDSKFDIFTRKQVLSIKKPIESMSYDNFHQRLKRHLDSEEFKAMEVLPEDYGTHSFRIGGSSVMGADQTVSPVFFYSKEHETQKYSKYFKLH